MVQSTSKLLIIKRLPAGIPERAFLYPDRVIVSRLRHIKRREIHIVPGRQFWSRLLDQISMFDRGFTQVFSLGPSGRGTTL
jgi:hypothetical protein